MLFNLYLEMTEIQPEVFCMFHTKLGKDYELPL